MLSIFVGIFCIIGGIGWALLSWFAAGMADRAVDFPKEVILPGFLPGTIAVLAGIAIIIWR